MAELVTTLSVLVPILVSGIVQIIREIRKVAHEVTPANGDSNGQTLAELVKYTHHRNHQFANSLNRIELKVGLEPTTWTLPPDAPTTDHPR